MFENLVTELTRLDRVASFTSDAERVDQLTALERVKAACAAVQARVTVEFAASQERVAAEWRARATACADGSDFDGWVAAREQARRATVQSVDSASGSGGDGHDRGQGRRGRGGETRSRRAGASFGVAGQVALARRESPVAGVAAPGDGVGAGPPAAPHPGRPGDRRGQ